MKRLTINRIVGFSFAFMATFLAGNTAHAFDMDSMVNDYTASTVDPNSRMSMDGRRGYMSGGSLRVRFDNKENPELYDIQLPSFKADCNGMDMNLGSLSWISADEFMDAARRMASPQVLIYALSLALNQMCGPCAQNMSDLQDKLNKYTDRLKLSCEEIGTALFEHSGAKAKTAELNDRWWGEASDESGDDAAEIEGESVNEMLNAGKQDELSKNTVWDYMYNDGDPIKVGGYLAEVVGETSAKEMIMSMTGTSIHDATGASVETEINISKVNPVAITLTSITLGGEIDGLICLDNHAECLDAAPGVIFDIGDPLAKQFFDMLDPHNKDSITSKYAVHYDGISLTNEELAFVSAAQRHFDIQSMMYQLAMSGQTITSRHAQIIAELMAIEITLEFMIDYVEQGAVIVANIDNKKDYVSINPFEMKANYRREARDLRKDLAEKLEKDADLSTILDSALNR